jgi:hypothetical protein
MHLGWDAPTLDDAVLETRKFAPISTTHFTEAQSLHQLRTYLVPVPPLCMLP